jgi:hypothetical protein
MPWVALPARSATRSAGACDVTRALIGFRALSPLWSMRACCENGVECVGQPPRGAAYILGRKEASRVGMHARMRVVICKVYRRVYGSCTVL